MLNQIVTVFDYFDLRFSYIFIAQIFMFKLPISNSEYSLKQERGQI